MPPGPNDARLKACQEGKDAFGQEAVDTLIKEIEDKRDKAHSSSNNKTIIVQIAGIITIVVIIAIANRTSKKRHDNKPKGLSTQ